MFDRKQQNSVKQLSFNQKIKFKKKMYKIVTAAEEKKKSKDEEAEASQASAGSMQMAWDGSQPRVQKTLVAEGEGWRKSPELRLER